ncbi:MAG: DUF3488 and transglutaminase-like domain-containing protein [Aquificaceae bacterium]|nr:DUF3488 and transglutaminase-like domain-containing protein [Aquificaceae bacterium]
MGIVSLWKVAEPVYFLIFLALYLSGVYMDIKGSHPVNRLTLNLLGIILTLYFISHLTLENPLKPFSHVVLLLLAIKSLEEKKIRDLYQMLLLSLFGLSISTAYSIGPSFLLFFLLHGFLAVSSLVLLNLYRRSGDKKLSWLNYREYILAGFALFLSVALLTFPLFFFLPRTQAPIFDLFSKGSGLKTGLAESIALGKIGEIQEDNAVVFRAYGLPQGLKDPYWRVIVFSTYSKNTWLRAREDKYILPENSEGLTYSLILEPSFDNMVPALDYPLNLLRIEGLSANAFMATGNVLRLDREINRAVRVTVSSSKTPILVEDPKPYLQIPKDISPNLIKLAEELSKGAQGDIEKIKRVLEHFSTGYQYTLKLEKYEGDPIDYFMFVSKKGNCEYYASATALLLRLMGVPTRVVGGYKGALWNPYGNYHIVTNSMAHVWVEAYVEGKWLRIDTTPPYMAPSVGKISGLSLLRDSLVSFWYSNVVGYSSEKQIKLFKNIGEGFRAELRTESLFKHLIQITQWLMLALLLYLVLFIFSRFRKTPENLYLKTRDILHREGLVKKEALPEEVLSACKNKEYYRLVKFILSIYQRHKYSPYRVYSDEIVEGYRAMENLRRIIRSSRRS